MSASGPTRAPPGSIPTLTEVVPWPDAASPGPVAAPALPTAMPSAPAPQASPQAAPIPPVSPAPPATAPVAAGPVAPVAALPPSALPPAPPLPAAPPVAVSARPATAPVSAPVPPAAAVSEAELSQRVLADLQRQLDLMLEVRLREVLAPILTRAADALIRDARKELTATLRDAVVRSVAQEIARRDEH
jgi:hypothetical protein